MLANKNCGVRSSKPTCRSPGCVSFKVAMKPVRARIAKVEVYASSTPLKVMISGAPAAGKGTQCAKIIEKFGLVHISVGDLLREQVALGTAAGKKAQDYMNKGVLVPDEVVVEMVKNRLAQSDVQQKGWLLDGYPRSASQAEAIEKEGIRPDVFILIQVPDEALIERVVGRRLDPVTGEIYHMKFKPPPAEVVPRLQIRSDDTEEKVVVRLQTHNSNVASVLNYYQDVIVEVDGHRSMEAVFSSVHEAISQAAAKKDDPLEEYCAKVPEADECRVYDD